MRTPSFTVTPELEITPNTFYPIIFPLRTCFTLETQAMLHNVIFAQIFVEESTKYNIFCCFHLILYLTYPHEWASDLCAETLLKALID